MAKKIKDKDPDCKIPIEKGYFRCGTCGLPALGEVVKCVELLGYDYDEGVAVGICLECQAILLPKVENDSKSSSEKAQFESIHPIVQATG